MDLPDPMHPLATVTTWGRSIVSWATGAPAVEVDALGVIAAVLALSALLWLATSGEQGGHRASPLRALALHDGAQIHVHTPKRAMPPLDDRCRVIHLPTEPGGVAHVGATEDWAPVAEVASVDNVEAEWRKIIEMARAEQAELSADISWTDFGSTPELDAALATAESWHAEHGRHCACCHVTVTEGEERLILASWRMGQDTIEIRTEDLVAAGVL